MNKKRNFYTGLTILVLIGIFTGWGKQNLTFMYFNGSVNTSFLRLYAYMDWIFGFLAPFLLYTFLCISTFLMARIMDERIALKDLYANVGIAFFPQLVVTVFATYILNFLEARDVDQIIRTQDMDAPIHWGVSLNTLKIITWCSYALLYFYLVLFLIKTMKFTRINAILSVVIPTLTLSVIYFFL